MPSHRPSKTSVENLPSWGGFDLGGFPRHRQRGREGAFETGSVFENVVINRGRTLAATVADESARLALTDVDAGQKVLQSDSGNYFWLQESPESVEANWAPLLTAIDILQLVIRTLHFYSPTKSETFVATTYDFVENVEVAEAIANFQIRTYLDPALPE